jgi:hypothetical protein
MPGDTLQLSVQAALDLARILRHRGLVAAGSAATGGTARVRVYSRSTAQLAGQAYLITRDGAVWFSWAGEPPRPAESLNAAADTITRTLTTRTGPTATSAGEPTRGDLS